MTPIPSSYEALEREVVDLRKRVAQLERQAETKAKTAHYPPVRPLRPVNFKHLGPKIADEDDGA